MDCVWGGGGAGGCSAGEKSLDSVYLRELEQTVAEFENMLALGKRRMNEAKTVPKKEIPQKLLRENLHG